MVAPLAGAWIEIQIDLTPELRAMAVAPLAGAWIEIGQKRHIGIHFPGRSPRGSVD